MRWCSSSGGLAEVGRLADVPQPAIRCRAVGLAAGDDSSSAGPACCRVRLVQRLFRQRQAVDGAAARPASAAGRREDRSPAAALRHSSAHQPVRTGGCRRPATRSSSMSSAVAGHPEGAVAWGSARRGRRSGRSPAGCSQRVRLPSNLRRPAKADMVDVHVQAHADGVGGHQEVDLAGLIKGHLGVAGAGAEAAHHHRRPAALAADQLGDGVDRRRSRRRPPPCDAAGGSASWSPNRSGWRTARASRSRRRAAGGGSAGPWSPAPSNMVSNRPRACSSRWVKMWPRAGRRRAGSRRRPGTRPRGPAAWPRPCRRNRPRAAGRSSPRR